MFWARHLAAPSYSEKVAKFHPIISSGSAAKIASYRANFKDRLMTLLFNYPSKLECVNLKVTSYFIEKI